MLDEEKLDAVTVARALGVHRRTVLRFIARGYFPNAFKAGQAWRIPRGDLEAFIDSRKPKAVRAPGPRSGED